MYKKLLKKSLITKSKTMKCRTKKCRNKNKKLTKYKTTKYKTKKGRNKYKRKNNKQLGGDGEDDSFFLCYDENLKKIQKSIELFSGKHQFDNNKTNLFINNQISSIRRQAAKDLIDNTIYITLREVSDIIEQLIIKTYTENNLNSQSKIYFYSGKPSKSFYFLSVLALFYIRKHNFKEPIFLKIIPKDIHFMGTDPLIILDDVSYSGHQLSTMLNGIYYENTVKNFSQTPPNIFVLLIALNNFSQKKLSIVPTKEDKYGYHSFIQSPFKLVFLKERLYTPLIYKIGIERYTYLNLLFSPFTSLHCTPYISLYLDHKLADENSTYTAALLYGFVIPNNVNFKQLYIDNDIFSNADNFFKSDIHEPEIIDNLLANLNESIKSEKISFKRNETSDILTFLSEKLLKLDIPDKTGFSYLTFYPFINFCNTSLLLIENITNVNIVQLNYLLFVLPKGCLEDNGDCAVKNSLITEYINSILELNYKKKSIAQIEKDELMAKRFGNKFIRPTTEELMKQEEKEKQMIEFKKNVINIRSKIYSYICPHSWYKDGEFQMICS